ncbi:PadR family transcriptional regulator [candidate division CSSED10-310 bacterium]|uniref:PadR family transcriptional regulator n=1 Tax=candidate division CSSED10-310 bacterium TaxID=2855610 RepID=A0ABV6YWA5_UNCC1
MIKKFRKELNSGTISLVILAILDQAQDPLYGYQIAKSLEHLAQPGDPAIKQGTLYPVLRSMERNQMLQSEVEPSVSGPPRRYYSITAVGREALVEWKTIWSQTRDFVDAILEARVRVDQEERHDER